MIANLISSNKDNHTISFDSGNKTITITKETETKSESNTLT